MITMILAASLVGQVSGRPPQAPPVDPALEAKLAASPLIAAMQADIAELKAKCKDCPCATLERAKWGQGTPEATFCSCTTGGVCTCANGNCPTCPCQPATAKYVVGHGFAVLEHSDGSMETATGPNSGTGVFFAGPRQNWWPQGETPAVCGNCPNGQCGMPSFGAPIFMGGGCASGQCGMGSCGSGGCQGGSCGGGGCASGNCGGGRGRGRRGR